MSVIVDTNVPLTANGQAEQASVRCVANCGYRLLSITNDVERLVLDDGWEIIREYMRELSSTGQPGVGDAFLKWVLTNWTNSLRCELLSIAETAFPNDPTLHGFDISDYKFVLLAIAHPNHPPIWNAVDSDWWNFRGALARIGVTVDFVCDDYLFAP